MRIAHVITYISEDGAFGGPVAVMSGQVAELARRGHEVEIFAGWDQRAGFEIERVTPHLFPTRRLVPGIGFSGMTAPGLRRDILQRCRSFDVVHVHLARDLITMPVAASIARREALMRPRLVVQTHGMVKPDRRIRGRLYAPLASRVISGADLALALNGVDAERLSEVSRGRALVRELPNGVRVPPNPRRTRNTPPVVLFLARLHPRKRVLMFAEAARVISGRGGGGARFVVVGPDGGDLAALRDFIDREGLAGVLEYDGAVPPPQALERLSTADIYVLPSADEPFPMSALEAMSVGTPSVLAQSCHIGEPLSRAGGALTFDDSVDDLIRQIDRLLQDPALLAETGERARRTIREQFSIDRVVDRLESFYRADGPLDEQSTDRDRRSNA